ncbi:hypothetical protein AB3662_03155 [Sorangium cellulosum]|uniref:hypothetical protein n=1 Tax=Sorangium cellulosum TaxID=56 RepID=UPI003D9A8A32
MSTVPQKRWSFPLIPLGLGAAACAACCAVPLLGLGLGAGGLGALVGLMEPMALGLVGIGLVMAVVAVRRRSNNHQASCAETGACSIDGACGCRPADARTPDRHDPAIACTLPGEQMSERLDEFRALLARALVRRQRVDGGFVWTLRADPGIEEEARALAAREQGCCSFFRFDISSDGQAVRWKATAPEAGWPMLELLYETSEGLTPPAASPPRPAA